MVVGHVFGFFLGLAVIGIGVYGVRSGKVLRGGRSASAPDFIFRDENPFTFWAVVSTWTALGTYIIVLVLRS
jgi:hypothetical protein